MLGKAKTTKESKYIIKNQEVLVNGVRRHDEKFPVGFLDVISLPALGENYRLLVNDKNKLSLLKINNDEAKLKLSKVLNKKSLSKDRVQVNCTDGRNFLFKDNDSNLKTINTNDSLLYTIPEGAIKQFIKLEKGAMVYLYKGKHNGNVVIVDNFKGDNIVFKLGSAVFETKKTYAFVIGKDKPLITITEKAISEKHAHAKEKDSKDSKEKETVADKDTGKEKGKDSKTSGAESE
jgi:small subunit ribosomal protein S4e